MPVRIGVIGKGDVKLVAHLDEARHGERRGTIHPYFSVPIRRHEAEGRIDRVVHDRSVDPVALDNRLPEVNGSAAQRIYSDLHAGRFHQLHVDDIAELGDVGADVIVEMRRLEPVGTFVRHPHDAPEPGFQIAIRVSFDDGSDVGIGRTAMRRIILVTAVLRRIVRRRDDDAIGETRGSSLVVSQDRARDDGGRRIPTVLVDHDLDAIRSKHLNRTRQRRLGQSVRVNSDEQRSCQAGPAAVVTDRLRRRQDVIFIEGDFQGRAAMARGSEGDALRGIRRIRFRYEIGGHQPWHVRERCLIDRFAGAGILCSHVTSWNQRLPGMARNRSRTDLLNHPAGRGGQSQVGIFGTILGSHRVLE